MTGISPDVVHLSGGNLVLVIIVLVIDMSEVEFLDSTGLGVLVGGLKKVRAHDGSLQLVCSQDRLLKIFRITGLAKVFVIHDTAEAALAAS